MWTVVVSFNFFLNNLRLTAAVVVLHFNQICDQGFNCFLGSLISIARSQKLARFFFASVSVLISRNIRTDVWLFARCGYAGNHSNRELVQITPSFADVSKS